MERVTAAVERLVVGALLVLLMVTMVEMALIALCNKVITLNLSTVSWTTLLAIAALILGLAGAIHALRGERR
jgi:hypothetical protein